MDVYLWEPFTDVGRVISNTLVRTKNMYISTYFKGTNLSNFHSMHFSLEHDRRPAAY